MMTTTPVAVTMMTMTTLAAVTMMTMTTPVAAMTMTMMMTMMMMTCRTLVGLIQWLIWLIKLFNEKFKDLAPVLKPPTKLWRF
jgi:hypothetical protein